MGNNAANAFQFLFEFIIMMYALLVLFRLLLQWVKADFYNPVSQVVVRLTDPVVKPLRRIMPPVGRMDTACTVLFLALVGLTIILWHTSADTAGEILLATIRRALLYVAQLYTLLIIVSAILSWVGQSARHPIIPLLYQLVAPVMQPIRRIIPPLGGIDFTPLIAIVAIQFLVRLLGLH